MLSIYVLILFAHVGIMGDGNSNAITTQEFSDSTSCAAAGKAAQALVKGTVKEISFVCVKK